MPEPDASIPGNFLTTAMAVMPHKDGNRALETALTMDIPFWPQLPNLSYYEDMYVQASENFPGIVLDLDNRKLSFSMDQFMEAYETAAANEDNPDYFDILSLDVFSNGLVFGAYAGAVKRFLEKGGVIVWGIVPTNSEPFEAESMQTLKNKLEQVWDTLYHHGVDKEMLIAQGLLSPATCCLVNPDGAETVEKAFAVVRQLSVMLRDEYVN